MINGARPERCKMEQVMESNEHDATIEQPRWAKHRFLIMIAVSIVMAGLLVVVSISMYYFTGTAQLDLSRPGYRTVKDQAKPQEAVTRFSSSGPVDEEMFSEFKKQYDVQAKDATSYDAFASGALSDQALGLTPDQQ